MGPKIKRLAVWPLRHRVGSVLAIVVLAIAGYFIYQQISLRQNKHDFEQARAAIDSVYADIVSQVGQPDDSKNYNNCSIQHAEFYNGPVSCSLNEDFIYGIKNEDQANSILKKTRLIINSHQFKRIESANKLMDVFVANTTYHTALEKYINNNLSCSVNYTYDTPSEITLAIKNKGQKPFEIGIGCYGLAKRAYYPLTNQ